MKRRHGYLVAWLVVGLGVAGVASADKASKRPTDEERGRQLYERHCIQCHGSTGAGDGAAARSMVAPIPDLKAKLTEANVDDEATVVLEGRGAMPAFETSFDKYDAKRVVRYAIKLGTDGAPPPPAAKLPPKQAKPPADTAVPAPEAPEPEEER